MAQAIKMARLALLQMDEHSQPKNTSRQIVHLDICLPVARARTDQCVDVDCQTCEEVLTRTQFEAIMKATGDKFVSTLENMQKLLGQHADTIVGLRRKLDQSGKNWTLNAAVFFMVRAMPVCVHSRELLTLTQFLKEGHVEMKRQMRLPRRQHHLSQLSAEQLRTREDRLNRFSAEQQKPSERK